MPDYALMAIGFVVGFLICSAIRVDVKVAKKFDDRIRIDSTFKVGDVVTVIGPDDFVVTCEVSEDLVSKIIIAGDCNNLSTINGDVEVMGDVTGELSSVNGNVTVAAANYVNTINGDIKVGLLKTK